MKIHWGTGIVTVFVVFVIGILALVIVAMSTEVDLVTDHPYDRGLSYQNQINTLERTAVSEQKPQVTVRADEVVIRFPSAGPRLSEGTITLYRPAHRASDFTVPLALDSAAEQHLRCVSLDRGLWRIKVAWRQAGEDYYFEEPVMLY
jgi:nitrogen fixation protein FixH